MHARVVVEDVGPPYASWVLAISLLDVVDLGDVGAHERRLPAGARIAADHRGSRLLVDVGDDDPRALRGHLIRGRLPMPWPAPVTIATLSSSLTAVPRSA